ncbi:DUF177 domain-containing protein [Clostridium sp. MSJ-11]|uniref:DUF177 domain-containing protein n=1 Tax=Clostridium mobile TaxID=2841512 RepID=A0ABS6EC18_9CLOT|nr:DUF177 domain-containing protein [Clostridium mobile]MBU5482747.1 DUF177 domain-containing protein [Clostridium mobile]
MIVDLSDLLKRKVIKKDIDITMEEKGFYDGSEYIAFLKPVKLKGEFNLIGDTINLNGTVTTTLELICSRCLVKFAKKVEIPIEEKLSKEENKDDDYIFIEGDVIDITEIIENNIIVSLPIKMLCNEKCKGLCPDCGVNLNDSACNCGENNIDPRLAKLKDFFSSN